MASNRKRTEVRLRGVGHWYNGVRSYGSLFLWDDTPEGFEYWANLRAWLWSNPRKIAAVNRKIEIRTRQYLAKDQYR